MVEKKKPRYTVEPGRQIHRDGVPFISIRREGDTHPADADALAHAVAFNLNKNRTPRRGL